MGVGPQAQITSAFRFLPRIASSTLPFVPQLPSSVAMTTSEYAFRSSTRNSSSRNPNTEISRGAPFSSSPAASVLASCTIGGIPIPPPMRKTVFPACPFRTDSGNPFPSGPVRSTLSPADRRENSSVPLPATRNTSRSSPLSGSAPQMLIGRGRSRE